MNLIVTFQILKGYLGLIVPIGSDAYSIWGHFTYINADGSILSGIRWVDNIHQVEISAQK